MESRRRTPGFHIAHSVHAGKGKRSPRAMPKKYVTSTTMAVPRCLGLLNFRSIFCKHCLKTFDLSVESSVCVQVSLLPLAKNKENP